MHTLCDCWSRESVIGLIACLFAVTLAAPASAVTVTVSGVVVDKQGARCAGVVTRLCYSERNKIPLTSDSTSTRGLCTLVQENAADITSIYIVVDASAQYAHKVQLVSLQNGSGQQRLGKADDIVLDDAPPSSYAVRLYTPQEATSRLHEALLAETLLELNGYKTSEQAQGDYKIAASRTLASLLRQDAKLQDMQALLDAAVNGIPEELLQESCITEDLWGSIPKSDDFRELQNKLFDLRTHLRSNKPIPDDVFRALLKLPSSAIDPEWLLDSHDQGWYRNLLRQARDPAYIGTIERDQFRVGESAVTQIIPLDQGKSPETMAEELIDGNQELKRGLLWEKLRAREATTQEQKELLKRLQEPVKLQVLEAPSP